MKILKTIKLILVCMCLFVFFNYSYASQSNMKLEVEKPKISTKYLKDNQGTINYEIENIDDVNGKADIKLTVNNQFISQGVETSFDKTEIYLIIEENIVTRQEEFDKYKSYIDTLITKVFESSENTKVGIIGIKGPISDTYTDDSGKLVIGDNDEGEVDGDYSNAEIVSTLSNNKNDLIYSLQNMNINKTKYYNNLQAALNLAKESFSDDANKILISLFNKVPSVANNVQQTVSYGGYTGLTLEEAVIKKHKNIVENTKSELLSLGKKNITFIQFRPKDTDFDQKWYSSSTGELLLNFDGSRYVNELYGTIDSPTYGKMYLLEDANIEKVITEYMYTDIMNNIGKDLENIQMKIYFTQELLDYFEINFLNSPIIDSDNLKDNGYVIWNIGNLKNNETSYLSFEIQLKGDLNYEIDNKLIKITNNIEFTYYNYLDTQVEDSLDDSPTLKLVSEDNNVDGNNNNDTNNSNKEDNTTANGVLPQTGENIAIFIVVTIILISITISYFKYKKYKI